MFGLCSNRYDHIRSGSAISVLGALSGIIIGLNLSSMSGKLDVMAFSPDWGQLMPFARELTTAMMPTGSVMGALLSWTLVDMAQPRLVTAYATLLWILGSLVQMIAPSIGVVRSGRLICGIAAGIISAVVPPYLAEIAGRSSRGKFASVGQLAGVSESDRMRYSASQSDSEMRVIVVNLLRCSFAVQTVPGFMLLLLCDFVPPSPRQLAAEGRWPEAKSLLADLHASGDGQDARVLAHIQELQGDILSQPQVPHPSGELLTWRVRERLVLGMLVAAWSQLCGVHLVLHTIMLPTAGAGFDSLDLVVGLEYVLYIFITLPAMSLLDLWGRRLMLQLGCLFMTISLCGMGFFQSKRIEEAAKDDNGLNMTYIPWVIRSYHGPSLGVILFCYLFIITYAVSWGPIAWVYPAEIFPGWLRTRGFSFLRAVGGWTFIIFGFLNWIVLLYVLYAAHETKGYTLEEMNHVFLSGRRAWQPVSGQRIFDLLVARIERRRTLNGTDGAAGEPGDGIELSEWASRQAGHPDASPS
ncbi:MFS permease [Trichoderma parareesei]|uniref:MFS permease n=1 Tax=Trichoderma parareesei TaxID=858221 RepID=A0A2H2ZAH1_TRIPA|nr:MFS permease [Trichoderma parareesei]